MFIYLFMSLSMYSFIYSFIYLYICDVCYRDCDSCYFGFDCVELWFDSDVGSDMNHEAENDLDDYGCMAGKYGSITYDSCKVQQAKTNSSLQYKRTFWASGICKCPKSLVKLIHWPLHDLTVISLRPVGPVEGSLARLPLMFERQPMAQILCTSPWGIPMIHRTS